MWSTLPPNLAALAFEFVALDDIAAAKPVANFVAAAARHALTQGRWRSHAVCARDGAAIVRGANDKSAFLGDAWRRLPLRDAWLVDADALVEIVTPWVVRYDFASREVHALVWKPNQVPGIKWLAETDPSVRLEFLRAVEPEVTRMSGRRIVGPLWRWCTKEPYSDIKFETKPYWGPRVSSIQTLPQVLKAWSGGYPGPDGEPRPMQFIADIAHGLGQWPSLNQGDGMLAYEFFNVGGELMNVYDFHLWVAAQFRPDIRRAYDLNEAGFEVWDEADMGYAREFDVIPRAAVADQITLGWKDREKAELFGEYFFLADDPGAI
jgi:hypothetical protein